MKNEAVNLKKSKKGYMWAAWREAKKGKNDAITLESQNVMEIFKKRNKGKFVPAKEKRRNPGAV